MNIMTKVGEALPAVVRGEANLLELLVEDNILSNFYAQTFGIQSYLKEVARMAGQISNKYPHINVLEIGMVPPELPWFIFTNIGTGAGAGETTGSVLSQMDTAFASYTYTDISETFFDAAQEKFQSYQSRMVFKVLDIEKNVTDQGYGEESFDLVIASLALYATKNLEATLSNVRRLLKPGGYLLLLEITDPNSMRFGLTLGGLPAWWLGHQEGRTLSPCVSIERWGELMKNTGFSGVDVSIPRNSELSIPFSVMLAQAVDDRVSFLRSPLAPTSKPLGIESLTIVGGKTDFTASLVSQITTAAIPHYRTIKHATSLAEINVDDIPVMGTVLSLTELDEPVLVAITSDKLRSFQELFKQSKNILWVGYGAQGDNPLGNMFTGVQRTLHTEMAHLRVQFLNFYSLGEADSGVIAKKLLHLDAADVWEQKGQLQDILWYTEPQLTVQNGKFWIPRFRLSRERNDRYNSAKRLIVKEVHRQDSTVTIQRSDNEYQVVEANTSKSPFLAGRVEIEVTHSLVRSIMVTHADNLFLVAGRETKSDSYVVALSENLDSRVHVPASWIVRCGDAWDQATRALLNVYIHFLVHSWTKNLNPGTTLAVLDPDFSMVAVLTHYARQSGLQLVLFTTKESSCSRPWIYIHPHSTRRELSNKIPLNIARLLNFGGSDQIVDLLRGILPADCQMDSEQTLTKETSHVCSPFAMEPIAARFQSVWTRAHSENMPVNVHRLPSLPLRSLIEASHQTGSQSMITWDGSNLPIQVRPATRAVKFAKDKTYWLVGLTGGLGLSLCQWMARQGARYIALSSRNPKIDKNWLQQLASNGCNIRVFAK